MEEQNTKAEEFDEEESDYVDGDYEPETDLEAELLRLERESFLEMGELTSDERRILCKKINDWCDGLKEQRKNPYQYEPNTRFDEATEEMHFPLEDLIAEIYPVLGDYFEAEINHEEDGIHFYFPNGQHFVLTARELTDD